MNQSKKEKEPAANKAPRANKNFTYFFTIAILAVIAVALIGGPAISGAVRGNQPIYGTYAGENIVLSPGNFFQRRAQLWANYFKQLGSQDTQEAYYQILQYAYSDTVLHMALLVAARNAGLGVSSEALEKELAQWPEFLVDGRFSAEEFQSMSSPARLVLREYLNEVLVAGQVRSDIASGATFSDAEIEFIAAMASPERRFRYVEFGFDSFPEDQVVAYLEENAKRFSQVNISQITIDSSQSDAESIRAQAIDRTSSFEDLAKNQSKDEFAENGGERGWAYYWDLEFDFEDLALVDELFSLDEGDISAVYETGTRWRIYKINEAPIEADFADPEVIEEARTYLTTFERGLIEDHLRITADVFAAAARTDGFTNAAALLNQTPALTEYFPVNYSNMSMFGSVSAPANTTIESSGAYREEFLQQLFALAPDQVSQPIVIRDYVLVFQLDDSRDLTPERVAELTELVPTELQRFIVAEANQAFIVDDLYVDKFNQTFASDVLGQ